MEKLIDSLRKENTNVKISVKNKERMFDEICLSIYKLINNTDRPEWNS